MRRFGLITSTIAVNYMYMHCLGAEVLKDELSQIKDFSDNFLTSYVLILSNNYVKYEDELVGKGIRPANG